MNKISEKKVKELIEELKGLSSLKDSKRKTQYWYQQKNNIVNSDNISTDLIKEFLDLYNGLKKKTGKLEKIETDDRAVTNVERDEEGLIQYYTFEIFRKDSPTLTGKLDRKEMETIYRLYTIYGANLTQKIVSREFPQYTFVEFKRILRAFNIYKANSEFAPHIIEERSEEELINLHNQNKENNVLRRIEKDQLAEANKLINKLARENLDLKKNAKDIHIVEDVEIKPWRIKEKYETNKSLMLHLSDIHVGAKCNTGSLYENNWDEEELERRLDRIVDYIGDTFGTLDTIVINMLGDYLDGMDNQTARRDHFMPQNMDNREQFTVFIRQMLGFIGQLSHYCSKIKIFAVPEGNHGGSADYMAIKALEYAALRKFPDIEFIVYEKYYGWYKFNNEVYVISHGKDAQFMKKPMPLNINDAASVMIRDWLDAEGIHESNVHIIKGDLHSNNLNSCRKFDYRNVLSLFGNSDYSMMNYPTNSYGISYDFFINDVRTIGTFENFLVMTDYEYFLESVGVIDENGFYEVLHSLPKIDDIKGIDFSDTMYTLESKDEISQCIINSILSNFPFVYCTYVNFEEKIFELDNCDSLEDLENIKKLFSESNWKLSNYDEVKQDLIDTEIDDENYKKTVMLRSIVDSIPFSEVKKLVEKYGDKE